MGLRKMVRATVIGAVMGYYFDPNEGEQRRAALRATLRDAKNRIAQKLSSARPMVEQAAANAKDRVDEVAREIKNFKDVGTGTDPWTSAENGTENAATEKGEAEARL